MDIKEDIYYVVQCKGKQNWHLDADFDKYDDAKARYLELESEGFQCRLTECTLCYKVLLGERDI